MPVFDFEAPFPNARVFGNSDLANVTNTITDAVNDTGMSVKFTVSYFVAYRPATLGSSTRIDVNIIDSTSGILLDAQANSLTTSLNMVVGELNPIDALLVFQLASTTPNRTGFSGPATVETLNGATFTGTVTPGVGGSVQFLFSNSDIMSDPVTGREQITIKSLTGEFSCFCAGTRVATPSGWFHVEDLAAGDSILLADGRTATVRWLGRQHVNPRIAHPHATNPIRITKGALGDGLPKRDLRVSQDHGIAIDGYLINAGALVNGTTIYQERDFREAFTYYHIETDAHELILAEGVAAETFIDYTTRDTFENAHEASERIIPEMPLPRISSARLVPDHITQKLRPLMAAE